MKCLIPFLVLPIMTLAQVTDNKAGPECFAVAINHENYAIAFNTKATLEEVETAWPSDMWQLRADLLGKSPHLSMDVLKAAADKTDVLPESVIFEIMAANPDELKKEELIKYLEDKENPLPEYMINILRQVDEGTTYKTVLEQEMAHYNRMKTMAVYDIIRSNLNDSITNKTELRNWLDNVGGKRSDEQIIETYMNENDFTTALDLADQLPALYNYTPAEVTEHGYYIQMINLYKNLADQGRTIFELDSTEVIDLLSIAGLSKGTAGAKAKGILEFGYSYHFCNCLNMTDSAGYKGSGIINPEDLTQAYGLQIDAEPNPARDWVGFNYILPTEQMEGVINIVDIRGAFLTSIAVNGQQGQRVWDIRDIKSGVYFYIFIVGEITQSGKIIISK